MAAKGRFRIPTLDEKDKAAAGLTKTIKPLFKNDNTSEEKKKPEQKLIPPKPKPVDSNRNNSNSVFKQNNVNRSGNYVSKANPPTTSSIDDKQPSTTSASSANTNTVSETKDVDPESLPTLARLGKTNSLVVNQRQRGNPILKHVRNVPWEFGNIVPDYVMGHSTCALFLSLRYHQLNPEYIHKRLKLLGKSFDLRVLLVQVDIKDPHHLLKDLAKMCILADCTLMLAFSTEEAGRYLETYKVYENKPPEAIMEKTENNFMAKMTDCLTTVKSVNKTDCMTLMTTFGSLETVMKAGREELSLCPGFGPQKAQRLHDVFHEPFCRVKKRKTDEITESSEEPKPSTSKSGS